MQNLLPNIKIIRIANATAAGTTDINGTVIDMQGFGGAMAIAALGALTATQVTKLICEQSDVSDGSTDDFDKIAETAAAADADGNKLLVLEVNEPNKRYLRFTLDRATANAVLDGIVVILYHPHMFPVLDRTTISQYAIAGSPDEV